jgi:hypothetical protein
MIDASTDPNHDHSLAALPDDQWQRWLPSHEHVEMPLGQVLYEADSTLAPLLPDHGDRITPVCDAERRIGGDRCGRQRRSRRRLPFHGRGVLDRQGLEERTCECYAVDTLADDGCHYHGDIREETRSC